MKRRKANITCILHKIEEMDRRSISKESASDSQKLESSNDEASMMK